MAPKTRQHGALHEATGGGKQELGGGSPARRETFRFSTDPQRRSRQQASKALTQGWAVGKLSDWWGHSGL